MSFGCGPQNNAQSNPDDVVPPANGTPPTKGAPIVKAESTYPVLSDIDVEYADGLIHDNDSTSPFAAPQKMDVYYPENDDTNRPVYMFIHGGGFKSGTKKKPEIIDTANYFTSRGWVFVSIDYRASEDLGVIRGKTPSEVVEYYKGIAPKEWVEYTLQEAESPDDVQVSTAMYAAQRDAKAALRWIVANADSYNINPDYITVGGASAGSITTLALGISDNEDFRDEISMSDDPTLATTNLDQSYVVKSLVYYWGSPVKLNLYEAIYGKNNYDSNDPELFMGHGTAPDPVTPYEGALALQDIYSSTGVYSELKTLVQPDGNPAGHGAWNAQVDGKGLPELSFDFLVARQNLVVQ